MRTYVMIGDPVAFVRTPSILNRMFADQGTAARVTAQCIGEAELPSTCATLKANPAIAGFLVTMPHKFAMAAEADELTHLARLLGAVNVLRREPDGRWLGAQFDGLGLVGALLDRGVALTEARVLLLGAGGAGRAIALALAQHPLKALDILDLAQERAADLVDLVRADFASAIERTKGTYDIIVNATFLGMTDGDPSPVDESLLRPGTVVADIVADPPRTRLASEACTRGLTVITGRDMVQAQAPLILAFLEGDFSSELEAPTTPSDQSMDAEN